MLLLTWASVIQSSMLKTFQGPEAEAFNPSDEKGKERPGLHIKLQDIQDYVERPCLKETIETMAKIQVRFEKGGCYISGLQKILPTPFSSGARSQARSETPSSPSVLLLQ